MVLSSVLEKVPSDRLAVHVVWTPVLEADGFEATEQARTLLPDPRVTHYWDGDQAIGLAYGKILDLPRGRELAWDIYFAFGAGTEWDDVLPLPDRWVHQLGRDERHLGDGATLRTGVEELLTGLESEDARSIRGLIGGR